MKELSQKSKTNEKEKRLWVTMMEKVITEAMAKVAMTAKAIISPVVGVAIRPVAVVAVSK